jgi:hypothetical protein
MLAVVSDSSPLIYLSRLGLLPLLQRFHEKVVVPQAVWQEVAVAGQGLPESDSLRNAEVEGWILVRAPSRTAAGVGASSASLGKGEIEAILLAQELAALLLTDDAEARRLAERVGVKVTGTLGVLVRAKSEGHVSDLRGWLDRLLKETNFRLAQDLDWAALETVGEVPSSKPKSDSRDD